MLLQDYATIRATAPAIPVTQSESNWLDLGPYRDVVLWLDAREQSGSVQLLYQTAVWKEDSLFATVATISPVSVGITTTPVLLETASVPMARWLRWQVNGANADLTFRIWVAASKPGRRNISRQ